MPFAGLVSYQRFVEWIPSTLIPLNVYLQSRLGTSTGIGFIDSTSIKVCQHGGWTSCLRSSVPHRHNRRIKAHRVFSKTAQRGKTSVDWFYGFKLHLAISDRGERTCPHLFLNVVLTPGNVDDRKPVKKLL